MSDQTTHAPAVRFTLEVSPDVAPPPDGTAALGEHAPGAGVTDTTRAPGVVVLRADGDEVVLEASRRLTLRVGASSLTLDADGTILLHGVRVAVAADEALTAYSAGATAVRGATVDIN